MGASTTLVDVSAPPAHSRAFRTRRFLNWFPLGISYALLYMGRYNLTVAKGALGELMTLEDFGIIFAAGTFTYAFAFLINGPLTDKLGGKKAMLTALLGAGAANLAMGVYIHGVVTSGATDSGSLRLWFSVLYAANMYFQSFGAVAIVKVNSSWFHVRERGGFSGIFGTMISSGIWLAFTVNGIILAVASQWSDGVAAAHVARWVFLIPGAAMFAMFAVELGLLKDRPGQAGHEDFDTGDASSGESGDVPLTAIMKRILTNPIILTVALIEFCTGVVRQGVMNWPKLYMDSVLVLPKDHGLMNGDTSRFGITLLGCGAIAAVFFYLGTKKKGARKGTLMASGALIALIPFIQSGWGGLLMVAGVIGGNVAGHVSDIFFQSRRAPAAGGMYGFLFLLAIAMIFAMGKATNVVEESRVAGLQPGDRVVEVAGKGGLESWIDVRDAVAAIPADCEGGAVWDVSKSMCSTAPKEPLEGVVASGFIPMVVERAGQRVAIEIEDPAPSMKAGAQRKLAARPESTRNAYWLGAVVFLMSLCVIGTHGLLSGTATMDFGGRRGAATAVGMIDGFVYLGTAVQAVALGYLTARDWSYLPWFLLPFTAAGFLLSLRIWNAKPGSKQGGGKGSQGASTTGGAAASPSASTGTAG